MKYQDVTPFSILVLFIGSNRAQAQGLPGPARRSTSSSESIWKLDSTIRSFPDTNTGEWVNAKKSVFVYDASGNNTLYVYSNW